MEHDHRLNLSYKSPVGLIYAEFYYTNDSSSANTERIWEMQRADVDVSNGIVSCPVPDSDFKYGFFYLKDHRHLSVSSEFVIK